MSQIIPLQKNAAQNNDKETETLFLTEKEIRAVSGFEDLSDEDLMNVINTLHQFSLIAYSIVTEELNIQMLKKEAA